MVDGEPKGTCLVWVLGCIWFHYPNALSWVFDLNVNEDETVDCIDFIRIMWEFINIEVGIYISKRQFF